MPQYEPTVPQGIKTMDDLALYLFRELQELARCLGGVDTVVISVKNVEPVKRVDGHVEYADGVNWNPGSGRGMYRYDSFDTSWHFLG